MYFIMALCWLGIYKIYHVLSSPYFKHTSIITEAFVFPANHFININKKQNVQHAHNKNNYQLYWKVSQFSSHIVSYTKLVLLIIYTDDIYMYVESKTQVNIFHEN